MRWYNKRTEGQEPFDWNTLQSASNLLGLNLSPEEAELILDLSALYVNSIHEYMNKDVPDPFDSSHLFT